MPKVNISLDADLVIDLMLLSGVRDAQDAVELVVRDYLVRGSRTEARTLAGLLLRDPPRQPGIASMLRY
jgi:Arc/MetJ family transcription regulator